MQFRYFRKGLYLLAIILSFLLPLLELRLGDLLASLLVKDEFCDGLGHCGRICLISHDFVEPGNALSRQGSYIKTIAKYLWQQLKLMVGLSKKVG